MTMDQLGQRLWNVLRLAASWAAIVVGATPAVPLPNSVRTVLIAFGGIIQVIEHAKSSRPPSETKASTTTLSAPHILTTTSAAPPTTSAPIVPPAP